jgi:hypothetical protein
MQAAMAMLPVSFEALDAASAAFDHDVARTPGIDPSCSASDWVIPAHQAFGAGREDWIFRGGAGWVALMRARLEDGTRALQPLEAVWGFASPCIGAEPDALAADLAALLDSRGREWDLALLTGMVPDSSVWRALVARLGRHHRLYRGAPVARHRASLAGGRDGFLARRSRNMRRSLVRAARAARTAGIAVEPAAGPADALWDRVLAVEARSWKGLAGCGILEEPMRSFYARMLPRLAARGALRLAFARRDGLDVGYILGGLFGEVYRGLQFSFDARLAALGIGNVLQLAQVEALCAEGVLAYDLGCEVAYKARWAESLLETATLLVGR